MESKEKKKTPTRGNTRCPFTQIVKLWPICFNLNIPQLYNTNIHTCTLTQAGRSPNLPGLTGNSSLIFKMAGVRLTKKKRDFSASHAEPCPCWAAPVPNAGGFANTHSSAYGSLTGTLSTCNAYVPKEAIGRGSHRLSECLHHRQTHRGRDSDTQVEMKQVRHGCQIPHIPTKWLRFKNKVQAIYRTMSLSKTLHLNSARAMCHDTPNTSSTHTFHKYGHAIYLPPNRSRFCIKNISMMSGSRIINMPPTINIA